MGIAHVVTVFCQLFSRFDIIDKAVIFRTIVPLPRAQMHLIHGHRRFFGIFLLSFFHPFSVRPGEVGKVYCNRSGSRPEFCGKGIGVCLKNPFPCLCQNSILIKLSYPHSGIEAFIDSGTFQRKHGILFRIPAISITYDGHAPCMRCPNSKMNPLLPFKASRMSTHLLINFIMPSVSKKIPV